jgi:asparagine synthase (glutamine-hydrolysing)
MTPRDYMERARHYRSLSSGWLPYFMEVATLTAAVAGMEARFPFCDPRLAEFCLGLPAEQKLSGGWSRMVMRRALEGVLPEEIRWRPGKARLGGGFRHGLLFYDRSRVVDLMENDSSHAWRYVDRDALRASFRRYADGGEGEQALLVWRAVTLGLWLDQVKI